MKYKTCKIPGAPDWMPEGVVCRVRDFPEQEYREELVIGYKKLRGGCYIGIDDMWSNAEPIPIWEPTPGEYCAFWDEGQGWFTICRFKNHEPTISGGMFYKDTDGSLWEHIARITGVDCACSLEELKERTDWL